MTIEVNDRQDETLQREAVMPAEPRPALTSADSPAAPAEPERPRLRPTPYGGRFEDIPEGAASYW